MQNLTTAAFHNSLKRQWRMCLVEGDSVHSFYFNLLFFCFVCLLLGFFCHILKFLKSSISQFVLLFCTSLSVLASGRNHFSQIQACTQERYVHSTDHDTFNWSTYHSSSMTKYSKVHSFTFLSFNQAKSYSVCSSRMKNYLPLLFWFQNRFSFIKAIKYSQLLKAISMICFVVSKTD